MEPRGPWKAKSVPKRDVVFHYVCAACRQQGTLLKCGRVYGHPECVERAGGRKAFEARFIERVRKNEDDLLRMMREQGTPRGVLQKPEA